jgi:hypothetical protein
MTKPANHSAAEPMLGYLYQCRGALLDAVRRVRAADNFQLHLETLDDVTFQMVGAPVELLQLKHHINKAASLTDVSTDHGPRRPTRPARAVPCPHLPTGASCPSRLARPLELEVLRLVFEGFLRAGQVR